MILDEFINKGENMEGIEVDLSNALSTHKRICGQLRNENEDLKKEMVRIGDKLHAGTLHEPHCNANHDKKVGGDACSCTLGRELKKLRSIKAELCCLLLEAKSILDERTQSDRKIWEKEWYRGTSNVLERAENV
nr:hypothetical protein 3 [Candidatus Omnitrophota bacterium]